MSSSLSSCIASIAPPALGESNQPGDRGAGGGGLYETSSAGRNGERCRAGDRIGLLEVSAPVEGVWNSRVREAECAAGLECALVMAGALSAAPLERERRCVLEYGERLRLPFAGRETFAVLLK